MTVSTSGAEVQCLATSKDPKSAPWKKLPERSSLASGHRGNRIPRSMRMARGKDWLLTLGSGIKGKGGAVLLYQSPDLRHGLYLHPLVEGRGTGQPAANPVDNGEMWSVQISSRQRTVTCCYMHDGQVVWKTGHYRDGDSLRKKRESLISAPTTPQRRCSMQALIAFLWDGSRKTRPQAEYTCGGLGGFMSLPRTLSTQCRWWSGDEGRRE